MQSYGELLRTGQRRLGIWGLGYIGYSSMANFARSGVRCLGYDVDAAKLGAVRGGRCAIPNMDYWLGFDVRPMAAAGLIEATDRPGDLVSPEVLAHLVCVPTERGARPWDDALRDVCGNLAGYAGVELDAPPLVIVESTVAPDVVDRLVVPTIEQAGLRVGRDILVGVAPRRDWFISPEKSLRTLPRVIGGTTPETTGRMREVTGLVCQTVLPAPDHRHAALVKSIENAYRQVEIALANQLALAYPDLHMQEILRLVGTKWNVGTYEPSFGTGGYCIPLAPHYVLDGASHPERLSILRASLESEERVPHVLAARIAEGHGAKRVGILGLAYKGDIKVAILSPTLRVVRELLDRGVEVKVNDPYYSDEEVRALAGAAPFAFPAGLEEFDTVVLIADHLVYRSIPTDRLRRCLGACRLIVDNTGVWSGLAFDGVRYVRPGSGGWL